MRAQVTIEEQPLSGGYKTVTVYNNTGEDSVARFSVRSEDAEYQLLAQAIDRFSTVMRVREEDKRGEQ
ncbi:hypothetical protein SEA_STEPHIG9_91 [Mycobacterium phage Stephig9]|uniref:Uncharacterized protein n=1 Tax=Mycobacterium phage Stephig9 TaxID=2591224 RepID=A0A514DHD3_9CAUD|nr:hypothetical protein SEA_STEPHIG9_91 [Mycobacterium phage Stephig9]